MNHLVILAARLQYAVSAWTPAASRQEPSAEARTGVRLSPDHDKPQIAMGCKSR